MCRSCWLLILRRLCLHPRAFLRAPNPRCASHFCSRSFSQRGPRCGPNALFCSLRYPLPCRDCVVRLLLLALPRCRSSLFLCRDAPLRICRSLLRIVVVVVLSLFVLFMRLFVAGPVSCSPCARCERRKPVWRSCGVLSAPLTLVRGTSSLVYLRGAIDCDCSLESMRLFEAISRCVVCSCPPTGLSASRGAVPDAAGRHHRAHRRAQYVRL